jgi:alpha-beta hydrolase superfamily lysophospholipase
MSERRRESPRLPLPGGGFLQGTLSHPGRPGAAAVLYVHGFGSVRGGRKAMALERACSRRGWTFAAFDFRGHGDSPGTLLELRGSALQEDLEHIAAYFAGRGVSRLLPLGSSMGAWAAAWFALRRRDLVPACALAAPAFDFLGRWWRRLDEAARAAWRQTGRQRVRNEWLDVEVGYGLMAERDRFPPERLAAEWATPLRVFHGLRDETVPYGDSLAFVERVACPDVELHLFKDGDHRLQGFEEEVAESACRFFARWQGGGVQAAAAE